MNFCPIPLFLSSTSLSFTLYLQILYDHMIKIYLMNLAPASPTEFKYNFLNRTYIFHRIKGKYNQCKTVKNIITEFVAQHD